MRPHPITILAIDPGRISGWAIMRRGSLVRSGTASTPAERRRAVELGIDGHGVDVVVREDWPYAIKSIRQALGLGATWGRWHEHLTEAEWPDRRIVRVLPQTWRRAVIGRRRMQRAQWKSAACQHVLAAYGVTVGDDEAEAVCIAAWAMMADPVWSALGVRERKRLVKVEACSG